MFYFHPYLGKWSNLTNWYFSTGLKPPTSKAWLDMTPSIPPPPAPVRCFSDCLSWSFRWKASAAGDFLPHLVDRMWKNKGQTAQIAGERVVSLWVLTGPAKLLVEFFSPVVCNVLLPCSDVGWWRRNEQWIDNLIKLAKIKDSCWVSGFWKICLLWFMIHDELNPKNQKVTSARWVSQNILPQAHPET